MTDNRDSIFQPTYLGNHLVSGVWNYMLPPQLKNLRFPEEKVSTCSRCPKCVTDGYRPDYRCCTYFPRVPNFMLGLALLDKQGDARNVIDELAKHGFLLPEGFVPTPRQWATYFNEVEDDNYGTSHKALCPFLNSANGFCKIYKYRNSVCSTFFCENDLTKRGQKFWEQLQSLASQCELGLSQWAMSQNGFNLKNYFSNLDKIAKQLPTHCQASDHSWSQKSQQLVWGKWLDKKLEFYEECAKKVIDHKSELWDIANSIEILEASELEKKSADFVKKKYRKQALKECQDDGEETVAPKEIWDDVLKAYHKMWSLPSQYLKLSDHVKITKNSTDDAVSKYYKSKDFVVCQTTKKNKIVQSHYIDKKSKEALEQFKNGLHIHQNILSQLSKEHSIEPLEFICEWYAKKVLIKAD